MSNQIRIIAGKYRGKKLNVINAPGLRPTPSRVRETLFNWLQFDIHDMHTLDLFAGSGLLSFEALSRGARSVTLIEKAKPVFLQLQKQAKLFNDQNILLHHMDASEFVKSNELTSYQLLFVDPPFHANMLNKLLSCLKNKLSPNTLLYIESDIEMATLPFPATILKQKNAGDVFYALFRI